MNQPIEAVSFFFALNRLCLSKSAAMRDAFLAYVGPGDAHDIHPPAATVASADAAIVPEYVSSDAHS